MPAKEESIANVLALCQRRIGELTEQFASLQSERDATGIAQILGPSPHRRWVPECQSVYRLALELGAVDLLPELTPPTLVSTSHDVLKRWNILNEWCQTKSERL